MSTVNSLVEEHLRCLAQTEETHSIIGGRFRGYDEGSPDKGLIGVNDHTLTLGPHDAWGFGVGNALPHKLLLVKAGNQRDMRAVGINIHVC